MLEAHADRVGKLIEKLEQTDEKVELRRIRQKSERLDAPAVVYEPNPCRECLWIIDGSAEGKIIWQMSEIRGAYL